MTVLFIRAYNYEFCYSSWEDEIEVRRLQNLLDIICSAAILPILYIVLKLPSVVFIIFMLDFQLCQNGAYAALLLRARSTTF